MKVFSWFKKVDLPRDPEAGRGITAHPDSKGRLMLNLGCGSSYHPAWMNMDFIPASKDVIAHDLRRPLPLADVTCDVVYASHVLEHFTRSESRAFLNECRRVLRPGGILRIVVPDLETIARLYLRYLDGAAGGDSESVIRHEWMTLELLDQLVRERSGGEMLRYWQHNPMPAEDFVVERMGEEVRRFLQDYRSTDGSGRHPSRSHYQATPTSREFLDFRATGENHKWMYDRVSLRQLIEGSGFTDARPCSASDSVIEAYAEFLLDTNPDGTTRKPDSLFMEAIKPR